MEKNHKNPNLWSQLPQDLVTSVFERLGFADFNRAKSVCSSWHSASRKSVPRSQELWLVLFPAYNNNNTSLTLFNPEETHKLYKTQSLGVEFALSSWLATYESWFLVLDPQWNLYIVNLFTHERNSLPPMESQHGVTKAATDRLVIFDHVSSRYLDFYIRSPVFWIDEKTKEYIVLFALGPLCVVHSKNGDNFWNQIPEISDCDCMLYKDHKLYFISHKNIFTVLDFSGQIPQRTFQCGKIVNPYPLPDVRQFNSRKIVVTITGVVLMVDKFYGPLYHMSNFVSSRFIHHQGCLRNMKELIFGTRQCFWI